MRLHERISVRVRRLLRVLSTPTRLRTTTHLVAQTAREDGEAGLRDLEIELFRPLQVMLADAADSVVDGIDAVATSDTDLLAEYKYDGVRIQLHKNGGTVRAYTHRLEEVTEQFPDVIENVRAHVTAETCILEGEVVATTHKRVI